MCHSACNVPRSLLSTGTMWQLHWSWGLHWLGSLPPIMWFVAGLPPKFGYWCDAWTELVGTQHLTHFSKFGLQRSARYVDHGWPGLFFHYTITPIRFQLGPPKKTYCDIAVPKIPHSQLGFEDSRAAEAGKDRRWYQQMIVIRGHRTVCKAWHPCVSNFFIDSIWL